jgi:UPF0755 protein
MKNDILPPTVPPRPQDQPGDAPTSAPQQPSVGAPILGDILPPQPQPSQQVPAEPAVEQPQSVAEPEASPGDPEQPPVKRRWNKYYTWIISLVGVGILLAAALFIWYHLSLQPKATGEPARVQVVIASGSSPTQIGAQLEDKQVIRNQLAFDIFIRLSGARNKLRAGTYSLSPAESTPQIVNQLTTGEAEQFDVTFYPGATLNIASTATDKTPSHRQVLEKLGYTDEEITEAFSASYDAEFPVLFSGKPASADLEGYIYGQTYKIASGSSVKQILRRTFAEYELQIKEHNLVATFEAQGLNLYQGITLASIIQREVPTTADQKQVAQIFLKRYHEGTPLGSDVTYHYAADKAGVARDHTLKSPYNTRIVVGLPPGPIASPGISALESVGAPAAGDYVYFLSGDDDKTYFARTNAEHEANIANHCAYKCSLP